MKNIKSQKIIIWLATVAIIFLFSFADALPWWSFSVPVAISGALSNLKKWNFNAFGIGFTAGFFVWFVANLYFHLSYNGIILKKMGVLLSIPTVLVMLIAGLIGGLVTGLALYTGRYAFSTANADQKLINE
jgi:hypothetical protein